MKNPRAGFVSSQRSLRLLCYAFHNQLAVLISEDRSRGHARAGVPAKINTNPTATVKGFVLLCHESQISQ